MIVPWNNGNNNLTYDRKRVIESINQSHSRYSSDVQGKEGNTSQEMNEGRVCTVALHVHQLLNRSSRRMSYNTFGSQPWTMVIYGMSWFLFFKLKG